MRIVQVKTNSIKSLKFCYFQIDCVVHISFLSSSGSVFIFAILFYCIPAVYSTVS